MERPLNILFLCTGNSARSIIAEALLNQMGSGRFRGFSAGSHPKGELNPVVMSMLAEKGVDTSGARSKSWDEFAGASAPPMDFIVTVCDSAASEACPIWPGRPVSAHWGVEDPAAHMDDPARARRVAEEVLRVLKRRIELFMSLPMDKLDRLTLQSRMKDIGRER
jgi:arsenate reductase (thioredoxin)